ncbi:purine-cytosine permease family protein [Corynebacterium lubricantis]|uniref:purine-cytosine permease family protein n=1 Tax=Corynebacterium lubricantis TaxID=541095 RepID=UPI00036C6CD2|nr:cytosine permease [Corynebacterium lubricantis]
MPDQVDPDSDNEAHNSGLVTDPSSDPDSDEASYGSSLIKAEPFGTEEIPDSERHGKPSSQFTLWFAANMVLAVLVSGFFAASFGLTIVQGISAVAVGSFAGALVMGLLAGIGARFGVPQQVQARGPMGYFANFIPIALLTNVSAIGWVAVNTVFAVLALQALFNIPFWIGAAVMFIAQALFAIWGHNLIHLLNKIATVVLTILFAIITVLALSKIEFSSAPLGGGEQGGLPEWITFAGFFFIYVMTWTPFASDFSRYLPRKTSHAKIVGFTTGGSFLSLLWLGSIGVLVSSFAGDLGAVEALAELTGSWAPLAMITIVLSTIPVSAMNLYGGSISLLTLRIPVSRAGAVVITAVLSYGLTLLMQSDPYGSFYDFLLLLGYLVVPFTTVLLADYFIRTKHMGTQALVELADTNRIVAWGFVSWIIGCLVSSLFWSTPFGDGPWHSLVAGAGEVTYYIGAAASLISYIVIHLARKKNPDATMVYRKAS